MSLRAAAAIAIAGIFVAVWVIAIAEVYRAAVAKPPPPERPLYYVPLSAPMVYESRAATRMERLYELSDFALYESNTGPEIGVEILYHLETDNEVLDTFVLNKPTGLCYRVVVLNKPDSAILVIENLAKLTRSAEVGTYHPHLTNRR